MNLQQIIEEFIMLRRALGQKYESSGRLMRAFGRAMGEGIEITEVRAEQVKAFLAGAGPITVSYGKKHGILTGFYKYAISCGYIDVSPLPFEIPKITTTFTPYIFSRDDLRRILQSVDACHHNNNSLVPATIRTIVRVLYATGLRCGEAIALNRADVDLKECVIIVRAAKFNKQRLVPFNQQLGETLAQYAADGWVLGDTSAEEAPFFITRKYARVSISTLEENFRQVCEHAGVRRTGGARLQPRLHDLRHTFAVHRLTEWYRDGADVQKLLPQLSVYLGHVSIESTQIYLTMTPELLRQASNRFEHYFREGHARD